MKNTTFLANPAEMIRLGAPRPIHTDEELEEYTRVLVELDSKDAQTPEEEDAIELLALLIERYENERYPIPDASPVEVLRFLLEQNGLSQRDIVPELGSESTVSLVLSQKRQLTQKHIAKLSKRFHVSPAAFFGESKTRRKQARSQKKSKAA